MQPTNKPLNSIKAENVGGDSIQHINIHTNLDVEMYDKLGKLESKMDLIIYLMEIHKKKE